MRGLVLFLAVIAIIGSFGLVDAGITDKMTDKEQKIEQPKNLQFNTFTSAVCSNDGKVTRCKDELFVDCNGEISKVDGIAECNGLKLDAMKPTGSAVFGKGWKDPRNI